MLKKYLLFLIIIAIAVSMVMNAMAAMTYVTLTIVNFTTAPTSGARTQMQFVQNSNSPFNITIYNSTYIQEYSEKRTAARTYTAGDLITVGPIDLITAGNYFFNITFDEVVVGGNYYGSCTTDAAWNFCTNCAGSTTSCPSQAGNVLNSNGYAPYINSPGSTSSCTGASIDVACTTVIATVLDEGLLESYSLGFTA